MKEKNSKFIVDMIRFSSADESADEIINHILEYICTEFKSDRAYVFEDNYDGTYRNTYEYCKDGVQALIEQSQNVQYDDMMDIWFKQYAMDKNVLISDLESYRKISESWYTLLKEQGVNTLVTGPIFIKGKFAGFYGVDNPPKEIMMNISEKIDVMRFIIELMLRLRNNTKALEMSSKTDSLTGCNNRTALEWAYDNDFKNESSICVIMCDLNGLKKINDSKGHKAGDEYIYNAAKVMCDIFGKQNVYRLGGDEFVVVLLSNTREEVTSKMKLFENSAKERQIDISYGVEYSDACDVEFESLLHQADYKMYKVKREYYQKII